MKLHSIRPRISKKTRKRVGRGNASGKGTFSGRGCKGQGQHASGNVRLGFEGGQTPLARRLPKLRGFKSPNKTIYQVVNIGDLNKWEEGKEVNSETLLEKKLVRKKAMPIKILGNGKLIQKLTLRVHAVSASAKDKVIAAGGKIL